MFDTEGIVDAIYSCELKHWSNRRRDRYTRNYWKRDQLILDRRRRNQLRRGRDALLILNTLASRSTGRRRNRYSSNWRSYSYLILNNLARCNRYPVLNAAASGSVRDTIDTQGIIGRIHLILKQSSEMRLILKELVTISIFDTQQQSWERLERKRWSDPLNTQGIIRDTINI